MTALSAVGSSLTTTPLPAADYANEPESIRNGGAAAKSAYQTGMAFENVLLNELTQQMAATTDDSSDGLGVSGSTDASTGSDALSSSAYSSLIPQTLSQSIMSSGGTGLAMQIAQGIDPALAGTSSTTAPAQPQ
jgi:Rod binding domain-containing protein